MRTHRFIRSLNLKLGELVLEDQELAKQLAKVLRLKIGSEIIISDGQGRDGLGVITDLARDKVGLRIEKIEPSLKGPDIKISLYCALLKKENFEWVVQKATELGVAELWPIITQRTVKTGFNLERWQKISLEACEQSGRGYLVQIHEPQDFTTSLQKAKEQEVIYFCHPGGSVPVKKDSFSSAAILVGPEGGWQEEEVALALTSGARLCRLSNLVLRAETAALAAISQLTLS